MEVVVLLATTIVAVLLQEHVQVVEERANAKAVVDKVNIGKKLDSLLDIHMKN